jgi:hypothetical protein
VPGLVPGRLGKAEAARRAAVASPILTDLSIYFAEQLRQVADLDIFERTHGVLDVPA